MDRPAPTPTATEARHSEPSAPPPTDHDLGGDFGRLAGFEAALRHDGRARDPLELLPDRAARVRAAHERVLRVAAAVADEELRELVERDLIRGGTPHDRFSE
jgi:hypothetical protein